MQPFGSGEIKIGLVEGRHDDGGREVLQHGVHCPRGLPIVHEGALEEGRLGAETYGLRDRHAGVDPKPASRMGCGLDDAPLVPPAAHHQQLQLPQLRVILTADLDEEGVQVDVEKSGSHGWSLHQNEEY
jgi:hypothetical protein